MNIKKIIVEFLKITVILLIVSNVVSYVRRPDVPTMSLENLIFTGIDGREFRAIKGKPLMIHVWARWCPTCTLEASNIQSISEVYTVLSIAVTSGEDDTIREYMHKNNLNFFVLNDSQGEWAKKLNVEAFPTTFIYNSKHELVFTEVGYTSTLGLYSRMKMAE